MSFSNSLLSSPSLSSSHPLGFLLGGGFTALFSQDPASQDLCWVFTKKSGTAIYLTNPLLHSALTTACCVTVRRLRQTAECSRTLSPLRLIFSNHTSVLVEKSVRHRKDIPSQHATWKCRKGKKTTEVLV